MTPSQLRHAVVAERIAWVQEMLRGVRRLPLATLEAFCADPRDLAAAESYLRRALEALLDLGRHILAKGFGRGVTEYKEIARELASEGVLTGGEAAILRKLASYRNRMVHFYHEVSARELYEICSLHLGDVETILTALITWVKDNPDKVDRML